MNRKTKSGRVLHVSDNGQRKSFAALIGRTIIEGNLKDGYGAG